MALQTLPWPGPREGHDMNKSKRKVSATNDLGVSPVIAVILMVAITVVLAATVYVWVSGFATQDSGPEQAAATAKGVDLSGDGDVEWIQVTLTSGQNAPYTNDSVSFSVTGSDGASVTAVCETARATDDPATVLGDCDDEFNDDSDGWEVGSNLWVPCQGDGNHLVTVALRGTTILDTSISCDGTPDTV